MSLDRLPWGVVGSIVDYCESYPDAIRLSATCRALHRMVQTILSKRPEYFYTQWTKEPWIVGGGKKSGVECRSVALPGDWTLAIPGWNGLKGSVRCFDLYTGHWRNLVAGLVSHPQRVWALSGGLLAVSTVEGGGTHVRTYDADGCKKASINLGQPTVGIEQMTLSGWFLYEENLGWDVRGGTHNFQVWDVARGKHVFSKAVLYGAVPEASKIAFLSSGVKASLTPHALYVAVPVSPDNPEIGRVQGWMLEGGAEVLNWELPAPVQHVVRRPTYTAALAGGLKELHLRGGVGDSRWDAPGEVYLMNLRVEGEWLVSLGSDGAYRLWLDPGKRGVAAGPTHTFQPDGSGPSKRARPSWPVAFHENKMALADGKEIHLHSMSQYRSLDAKILAPSMIKRLVWDRFGRLWAGLQDGRVAVWTHIPLPEEVPSSPQQRRWTV